MLPETSEGSLLILIETAKGQIRAKVEHPFRVSQQQFGFQKTKLRGMVKKLQDAWDRRVDQFMLGSQTFVEITMDEESVSPFGLIKANYLGRNG